MTKAEQIAQNPLLGLSRDQKRILLALRERRIMNSRDIVDLTCISSYSDLSRKHQREARNSSRKTLERLRERGLVEIGSEPNVCEKQIHGLRIVGNWGPINCFQLTQLGDQLSKRLD